MNTTQQILSALRERPSEIAAARSLEVGLSGGSDSVVLLFLLKTLCAEWGLELSAVHVHHGLQAQADSWAAFCRDLCAGWGIALRVEYVSVEPCGRGVEAAAREARYAAFRCSRADVLATAHHADDQTETFFLAALRGGGLRALAAMPSVRPFSDGLLWRPLLGFTREDLARCAVENGLPFVEDPMNAEPKFLRGWLRHYGLPEWKMRVPQLDSHIGSTVAVLQDELAVLQEALAADRAVLQHEGVLDVAAWRKLSAPRRRVFLADWAKTQGLGVPPRRSLENFAAVLEKAAAAQWRLSAGEALAYQNRLFALPDGWRRLFDAVCAGGTDGLVFQTAARGLPSEILPSLRLRKVRADDVLAMKTGRKKVMKLLQEYRVPPPLRPLWPVLEAADGSCAAVPNIRVADGLAVAGGLLPAHGGLAKFVAGRA